MAFRHSNSKAREEAIQEAIANAMVVYVRLVQFNKVDLALKPIPRQSTFSEVVPSWFQKHDLTFLSRQPSFATT